MKIAKEVVLCRSMSGYMVTLEQVKLPEHKAEWFCGYLQVPQDHVWYQDTDLPKRLRVSYSDERGRPGEWWVGFNLMGHGADYHEAYARLLELVTEAVNAQQIAKVQGWVSEYAKN